MELSVDILIQLALLGTILVASIVFYFNSRSSSRVSSRNTTTLPSHTLPGAPDGKQALKIKLFVGTSKIAFILVIVVVPNT
jgi:hypothetical protein